MVKNNIDKKTNLLQEYILDNFDKTLSKTTVTSIIRSILSPVLSTTLVKDSLVLLRMSDTTEVESLMKRLEFSNSIVYSYSDNDNLQSFPMALKENIWGETQFVVVITSRYCAAFIWDYSFSNVKDNTPYYFAINSRLVCDILNIISSNSKIELTEYWTKYTPERRANELLNQAIGSIINSLNTMQTELEINGIQNEKLLMHCDSIQKYTNFIDRVKVVTHEMNNQLSVIGLNAKILENKIKNQKLDTKKEGDLLSTLKNIEQANYSNISLLSQVKSETNMDIRLYKINDFINNIISLVIGKIDQNKIKLNINVEENELCGFFDAVMTQNVFINLIFNAIEATGEEGVINIDVIEESNSDNIDILIENTGTPIAEENKGLIFKKGFTTKEKGNGIGLFISQQTMLNQNGDLKLVKSDDVSTIFALVIKKG